MIVAGCGDACLQFQHLRGFGWKIAGFEASLGYGGKTISKKRRNYS
jgi:hypothetical protein